jgi:hypothetical protein
LQQDNPVKKLYSCSAIVFLPYSSHYERGKREAYANYFNVLRGSDQVVLP